MWRWGIRHSSICLGGRGVGAKLVEPHLSTTAPLGLGHAAGVLKAAMLLGRGAEGSAVEGIEAGGCGGNSCAPPPPPLVLHVVVANSCSRSGHKDGSSNLWR